jgi:hypothetical protein
MAVTRREALLTAVTSGLVAAGVAQADEKPSAQSNVKLGSSARPTAFIADIGTVLRLTPDDDLQIASGDGVYCFSDDRTPFYFQVQGHVHDGQLFYGLFGPVLAGSSRYEGAFLEEKYLCDEIELVFRIARYFAEWDRPYPRMHWEE